MRAGRMRLSQLTTCAGLSLKAASVPIWRIPSPFPNSPSPGQETSKQGYLFGSLPGPRLYIFRMPKAPRSIGNYGQVWPTNELNKLPYCTCGHTRVPIVGWQSCGRDAWIVDPDGDTQHVRLGYLSREGRDHVEPVVPMPRFTR
jgi:hypothetical protein